MIIKRMLKFYRLIIVIFFAFKLQALSEDHHHILYLVHSGKIDFAFSKYQEISDKTKRQNFDLLQKMALILLEQGAKSSDFQTQQLSIFGAGIAASSLSFKILEEGLFSSDPQIQLLALHFIAQLQEDRCDELLKKAMHSKFLFTRLEAAYQMAIRKHPHAVGQIESLMNRLPPFFKPFFPSFFAATKTPDATKILVQLLYDMNIAVRVEAILSAAHYEIDELLYLIRKRASYTNIAEQEACAFALGVLKDSYSVEELKKLSSSPSNNVKIAAAKALVLLGDNLAKKNIEEIAKKNDLFAIAALADIEGSESTLAELLVSDDKQIRLNAAISLLKRKDNRSVCHLKEIFLSDIEEFVLLPKSSIGKTLTYWKITPTVHLKAKIPNADLSSFLTIKENLLKQALELPPVDFLKVAKMIFDNYQKDLIPTLVSLLENLRTPEAVWLLKEEASNTSIPFIRTYCNLALFKLQEKGKYEEYLKRWVLDQNNDSLVQLHPITFQKGKSEKRSLFELSSAEKGRLLIEIYLALANRKNETCINILIEAIKKTNLKNRYVLAGLLLRSTE